MSIPNPHGESRPWKNQALKTCNPQIAFETIGEVLDAEMECRENSENFLPVAVQGTAADQFLADRFLKKQEIERAKGKPLINPAPDRPGVIHVLIETNSPSPRRFITPPDELGFSGNPIPHLRELEVATRTRLRNDENPIWYFRLHHQFKQEVDPNSGVSFADYCEQLYSDRIESVPVKSNERHFVRERPLSSKSAISYSDQERIDELFEYVREFREAIRVFRDQDMNFHVLDRPDILQSPPPISSSMQSLVDADKRRNPNKVLLSTNRCWEPKWNEDAEITQARKSIVSSLIALIQSWSKMQNSIQIMSERDPVRFAKFAPAFLRLQCALEILTEGSTLFQIGGDVIRNTIRLFEDSFILADRRESERVWRELQHALPHTSERHLDLSLAEFDEMTQQRGKSTSKNAEAKRKRGRPSGPRNHDEAEIRKSDELIKNQWDEFVESCKLLGKRPQRAEFAVKIGMAGRVEEIKEAIRRHNYHLRSGNVKACQMIQRKKDNTA